MRNPRERVCRICFGVLLAVGIGFLFVGLVVVPLLPHLQLDAVLTPWELADRQKRDATLVMLKRAAGNQWLFWAAGGLVVTVTSVVGLRAALGSECGEKVKSCATDEL
jgi:hypothetical protein